MRYNKHITVDELRSIVDYNPYSGIFTWKVRRGSRAAIGDILGSENDLNGYLRTQIRIQGKRLRYYLHRLAWFYVYGEWPEYIDHINGNPKDNRLSNLRSCNNGENCQNREPRNRKGNLVGAQFHKRRNQYLSRITIDKVVIFIGWFDTEEAAHIAYLEAKSRYHPFQPVPRKG